MYQIRLGKVITRGAQYAKKLNVGFLDFGRIRKSSVDGLCRFFLRFPCRKKFQGWTIMIRSIIHSSCGGKILGWIVGGRWPREEENEISGDEILREKLSIVKFTSLSFTTANAFVKYLHHNTMLFMLIAWYHDTFIQIFFKDRPRYFLHTCANLQVS